MRLLSAPPYATSVETVFVIGGASAFAEALRGTSTAESSGGGSSSGIVCDTVYLTRVLLPDVTCDVTIPPIDDTLYALDELKVRMRVCGGEEGCPLPSAGNPRISPPPLPLSFTRTHTHTLTL